MKGMASLSFFGFDLCAGPCIQRFYDKDSNYMITAKKLLLTQVR